MSPARGRPPSLRALLAELQAEADLRGQSRRAVLAQGATVQYRSKVEGDRRRRQLIVGRKDVQPGVIEMQTFAGHGHVPDGAAEAHYMYEQGDEAWFFVTLTWDAPHVVMPQEELPL